MVPVELGEAVLRLPTPCPPRPLYAIRSSRSSTSLAYAGSHAQPPASIIKDVSVALERGDALVLVGPVLVPVAFQHKQKEGNAGHS